MVPRLSRPDQPALLHARHRSLLTADRVTAWSATLLVAETITFLFFVAGTHGWIVRLTTPATTDYVSFYAAGRLAAGLDPTLAYNQPAHYLAEQAATAPGIGYVYFFYPPVFLLLCRLLALLPYLASFVAFELATGLAWLAGIARILRRPGRAWLLTCLAFPAVLWNAGFGQNGLLSAALFAFATVTLERRPWLAGLLFGALCYKPHFGLLIPVALLAGRRWSSIAGAGISVCGLVLLSVAAFGWRIWPDFAHIFLASRTTFEAGRVNLSHLVTPFGAALLAGATPGWAYRLQAMSSLLAAGCVAWLWWRDAPPGPRNAALIVGTLLSVPVALTYDLVSAFIAGAWLVRDAADRGEPHRDATLLAVLFLTPLVSPALGRNLHLQLATFALLALLVLSMRRGLTLRGPRAHLTATPMPERIPQAAEIHR